LVMQVTLGLVTELNGLETFGAPIRRVQGSK
jgi:hypothetical protein